MKYAHTVVLAKSIWGLPSFTKAVSKAKPLFLFVLAIAFLSHSSMAQDQDDPDGPCSCEALDLVMEDVAFLYGIDGPRLTAGISFDAPCGQWTISYEWLVEDSTYITPSQNSTFSDAPDSDLTHSFSEPGVYDVCVEITLWLSGETCVRTLCWEVVVEGDDPCEYDPAFLVSVSADGCVTTFNPSMTLPFGVTLVGINWNFGDGNSALGTTVSHAYAIGSGVSSMKTICMNIVTTNGTENCTTQYCQTIPVTGCFSGKSSGLLEEPSPGQRKTLHYATKEPSSLTLWPNPSTGHCELVMETAPIQSAHVYNVTGTLVFMKMYSQGLYRQQIDITHLKPGIYFVQVNEPDLQTRSTTSVVIN